MAGILEPADMIDTTNKDDIFNTLVHICETLMRNDET